MRIQSEMIPIWLMNSKWFRKTNSTKFLIFQLRNSCAPLKRQIKHQRWHI